MMVKTLPFSAMPIISIFPISKRGIFLIFITLLVFVVVAGLIVVGSDPWLLGKKSDLRIAVAGRFHLPKSTAEEQDSFLTLSRITNDPVSPSAGQQSTETLTLDQVLHALALIPSMTPGDDTDAKELSLVLRWVSFEPERACEYAYHAVLDGADENLLRAAVSAWARIDPDSASRWSSKLRSPLLRDIAVTTAFGIWMSTNQSAAMSSLKFLQGSATRSSAWSGMANVSSKNPKAALTWVEKLPGPIRDRLLQQVFGSWIRRDPLSAAEWLSKQPMDIQLPLAGRVAAEWARKDPQAALYWVLASSSGPLTGPRLTPGPVQRRALDAALGSFVSSDPEAAAVWMTTPTGRPFFSQRVASIASSWASIDPYTASSWVWTLQAGKDRDAAVGALSATWTRSDPAEALRWIQGIRKASDRNTALSSFGAALASTDPETAAYWSTQISERSLREETLTRVISQWRIINPGAATQFIQTSNAMVFMRKKP